MLSMNAHETDQHTHANTISLSQTSTGQLSKEIPYSGQELYGSRPSEHGMNHTWITVEVGNTRESSLLLVHVNNSCNQDRDQ